MMYRCYNSVITVITIEVAVSTVVLIVYVQVIFLTKKYHTEISQDVFLSTLYNRVRDIGAYRS